MPETAPVPLAERLAGQPARVSVKMIAEATGASVSTVRNWVKQPGFAPVVAKEGRTELRDRETVAEWLRENEAERPPALTGEPDEMLSVREVAERTGIPYGTVSSYPSLYGPDSKDPFPRADNLGRRQLADVAAWLGRRSVRGGPRATAEPPAAGSGQQAGSPSEDVIRIAEIVALTGRDHEAVKSLMRRPDLAAMSKKIGNARVWPREPLLAELRSLGYLPAVWPQKTTAVQKKWLASGSKSASELAKHYGVTVGAITHRIQRARANADSKRQPPAPVDPAAQILRYDPADFEVFWNPSSDHQ